MKAEVQMTSLVAQIQPTHSENKRRATSTPTHEAGVTTTSTHKPFQEGKSCQLITGILRDTELLSPNQQTEINNTEKRLCINHSGLAQECKIGLTFSHYKLMSLTIRIESRTKIIGWSLQSYAKHPSRSTVTHDGDSK